MGDDRRLSNDDPIVIEIVQRLAKLEARVDALEKQFNSLKEALEDLRAKVWWILAAIILSILLEILLRVVS